MNHHQKTILKKVVVLTNKNARVLYRKLEQPLKKYGYINLNHRLINTKDDLVELSSIFRDTRYETFRIIYLKDNSIVGYESVSTKMPDNVDVFYKYRKGRSKSERGFYKISDRMNKLHANNYYLVHNHPTDKAIASNDDIQVTEEFAKRIKGFKGHLIINTETYAWISINEKGFGIAENNLTINQKYLKKMNKSIKEKSIYDVKINRRDDLISLMHNIKNSKDYSIAILTDSTGRIRMILDVPNNFMNMSKEQINGYFKNLAKNVGAIRVFFSTQDNDTYKKAVEHQKFGTFRDCICYKYDIDMIYVYEKADISVESDLFDSPFVVSATAITVNNIKSDYNSAFKPDLSFPIPKGKLRILYKEVGKKPQVKVIDNTLEAKQKLVNGLIEVVPYDNLLLICNEEGKLLNLSPNLIFDYDYIAGNCFLVGDDYEHGNFKSLTDDEIIKYTSDLENRSLSPIQSDFTIRTDRPSQIQEFE